MGHSLVVYGYFCLCLCNYLIYWYIVNSSLSTNSFRGTTFSFTKCPVGEATPSLLLSMILFLISSTTSERRTWAISWCFPLWHPLPAVQAEQHMDADLDRRLFDYIGNWAAATNLWPQLWYKRYYSEWNRSCCVYSRVLHIENGLGSWQKDKQMKKQS